MKRSIEKQGILFIISAPSGAGKTTLVKSLVEQDPRLLVSVSHTTRPRRADEADDIAYHFVDELSFEQMVADDIFLEHAKVFDHYYGTSRQWVEDQLSAGNDVVLEIDWQGANQIRQAMTKTVSLFIMPPSFHTLEQRLSSRGEDIDTVKRRMRDAEKELSHYNEYDFLVINDGFDVAMAEITVIIRAMRHGYSVQNSYFDHVAEQLLEQATEFN